MIWDFNFIFILIHRVAGAREESSLQNRKTEMMSKMQGDRYFHMKNKLLLILFAISKIYWILNIILFHKHEFIFRILANLSGGVKSKLVSMIELQLSTILNFLRFTLYFSLLSPCEIHTCRLSLCICKTIKSLLSD